MKISIKKFPLSKRTVLLICFFASMFFFASFTKEDKQRISDLKLKMMEKYFPHKKDIVFEEINGEKEKISHDNKIQNFKPTQKGVNSLLNTFSSNVNIIPEILDQYESLEKQGIIGEFSNEDSDNPSDNFFTVNIPAINTTNTKAYLIYDLFGLDGYHSVSRSINKNLAFGGNIIVPSNKWSTQKEQIGISSLQPGKNIILFTTPVSGIKYKVKNVKIVFEKDNRSLDSISALLSGNQLYLKGLGSPFDQGSVQINNTVISKSNGEFEAVINLHEEDKRKGFVSIVNGTENKQYKIPQNIKSFKIINDEKFSPEIFELNKDSEFTKNYEGTIINVEKNSVSEKAFFQVIKLRKKDYPAVMGEIKNMTPNSYAYRLQNISGKVSKKIKLSIPYDEKKLGARSAKELRAFYFDYASKKWRVDPTGKVDSENKVITVEGDGDTDYINGIISVPESSQLDAFAPTSISGLKAADPTAGLQLMAVPTATQKGDASANYPIRVPSGIGGMQPSLSIGYSSGGGNGWMGDGWSINGLSSITVDTRWGVPAFDTKNGGTETELYSLDGEMLVYPNSYLPHRHNDVSENNAAITTDKQLRSAFTSNGSKQFYLRKNHDFSLIERIGTSPGNYTWKVTSTDGTKSYYGGSPDSMLSGSGGIAHWALRLVEDVHGNTMEFTYYNEGATGGRFFQIKKVAYGKNKDYTVNFNRQPSVTRNDISINAKQGFARSEPYLLKDIEVKYKTELVRTYKMDYIEGEFYKTLLKRIYIVPHNPCSTTLASREENNTQISGRSERDDIDDGSGGNGGSNGGIEPTCNEITDSYTFDYYNDVRDNQGNLKIFGPDTAINVQNDKEAYSGVVASLIRPSKINGNISSESGLNIRPAAGLNFYTPSSSAYGHLMFGFPFGNSKAKARNAQQLIDFNGDGIQDMIYRVPDEGLFLRPGKLDVNGILSFLNSQRIENYSGDFSFTETSTKSRGWDMGAIVYSRSQITSNSTGSTTTYLTDANSDGLMDIVHNGEVWFNRFDTNSNKSEMTKHSEYTENMVVKAKAVQQPIKWCGDIGSEMTEPCPEDFEELIPDTITDVVKVWIAPKDGYVRFTDNVAITVFPFIAIDPFIEAAKKMFYSVEIQNPSPMSGTTNVYSNTRIYLKEIAGMSPNQGIEINHYNDYFTQMQSVAVDSNYGLQNGINNPNRLFVKSGDKIYVRLHKNTVQDFAVDSNPTITYVDPNTGIDIPNSFELSQNQFQLNNGSYGDNFFLNNLSAPIYLDADGMATINVQSFTFPSLTDDVKFKIVKENATTGVETVIQEDNYSPTNLTTQAHTINVNVNSGDPIYIKFIVTSDSHTDFITTNWNDKINVFYTFYNPYTHINHIGIPEYPSFAVTQLKPKFDIQNIPNNNSLSGMQDFSVNINKNITNYSSLSTGTFYYVIKSGNQVLGKRRITVAISNGTGTLIEEDMISGQTVSGSSPINFYSYDPTWGISGTDHLITLEVYCKTTGDYDLFNKYSSYFQNKPFNIYYAGVNIYGTTSATAVNTSMYSTKTAVSNNWGQFLYQPGEFFNYKYGHPIGISDFSTPVIPQNTYQSCLHINNDNAALAECILNVTPNLNTGVASSHVALMKVRITTDRRAGSLKNKWIGSGTEQYSAPSGFNTDETTNYFTDPVPALPTVTPSTYVSGQLSVDTSMKAISRNQKSSSRNTTDGLSSGMVSGGNSETELVGVGSIETQTFSDMNGDGYPDMVYPQSIQFTNSTGSLEDIELQNYGDYPTNSLSYQKSNSAGFSFNAFSVTGRIGAHGSNGTTTRANSGMPWSGSASVSASYNNYYNSYDKGEGYWMDINGDGLPDRIRGGGSQYMRYSLNLGKSLAGEAIFPNMITYSSHPKANASISLGGALGASANLGALASFGFGISAGASASSSKGSADVVFEDVNSDGLVDILEVSGNSTAVRYNLGNRFQTPMPLLKSGGDINFEDETISYNGSLSFGANYMFNIGPVTLIPPVVVLILWIKAGAGANVNVGLNVSETKKAFKDMNGDGYTDLVQDTNNGFIVNYSQINRTNKLKSITNTISKGRYDLDYEIIRANYNNPYAKLVVKKISVVESNVFSQNYTTDQGTKMETNYSFRNRKYDRREREDFGFDTVIKQEMNGALAERVTTDYYYNNTYLMNGLIKQSMVQNGSGSLLSDIIYDYKLRRFSNSLTQIDLNSDLGIDYDKGGSEGRKMAIALLDAKVKTIHEAGGSLSTRERFTYTNKGLLKQYQYGSPSISYNTNITYQSLSNNIIGVPTLVEVYEGNTQSTLLRQRRAENINTYNGNVGSYVTFDGSNDIYTDIQYYANGNIKKVIYPPNELGQRYEVNYTYDDAVTGKYVIKVKDIFNIESSATYNPLFDVVTRKVDTGGNAMVFYYDGFGRTRSIMGPNEIANGSTVPTVKYRYWTDHAGIPNNDATIKIYRASTSNFDPEYAASNNTIMTDTYSDFLGRIIQVKKDVEISGGEGRSVSGRAIFDGLGRVVKQHHPTAEPIGNQNLNSYTPPSISTVATYDSRDRVTSATDEDGNTKFTTYSIENNLLKVTEEFMNQKSESYSTPEGKVVIKNDYLYQQPLTTLFEYSTIGELLSVKDPEGIATEFSYNLAGRRMQQIHPDKGITSYEYDLSGNLIRLTTDNLLNDSTINNHFIEYKYDHNRLAGIVLPDLPSGDPNPNNVIYQYGSATAGNNAGKLINKTDGAGDTVYKYGRMGEVIYELKKVRGHHIPEMYFKTYFNYDSWNRLTKIKYPDNEIVSYHYDRGGNLKSVDNNYGETYIQNIRYDYYEQREFVVYGNGTSQSYQYNTHNRRMDKYYLYSSNNIMLNNSYEYDEFANITKIKNEAYPLANGMGGAYQSYFGYDTLNRLIGTGSEQTILDGENQPIQNTFIAQTTYQLEMEYNNAGGIVLKRQHHERDQNVVPENTYDNKYEYISGTHKLSVANDTQTGNYDSFEYDYNGNAIIHSDNNGDRKMFWDEQDRLKAFYNDNNGIYQYYTYDDKGERVVKYGLEIPTQLYQNGVPVEINELKLFEFKIYPNPYVTVSSTGQYTKHYFEESKRFASRLLDGAVRYEDPSVLYTSRSAEEPEPSKPADVKSDFERYLEKSGVGDGVSVELRERPWTTDLYYLHGDHLGTATFVTNSQGDATQFFLNLPFGETMLEQMDGSYDNPFKFNAKELDEDTGLYYYGARYYNPRLSIWYGVDPLAIYNPVMETQFYGDGQHNEGVYYWGNLNPYIYTYQNPVIYIDPNGKQALTDFASPEAAHKNFSKLFNDNSIRQNREYVATIYSKQITSGGQKKTVYGYSIPARGTIDGADPSQSPAPRGTKAVAITHSHAAYDVQYSNNIFSGVAGNPKSSGDMGYAERNNLDIYVSTPNGSNLKYNNKTNKISILDTNAPSDPNDPTRKNSVTSQETTSIYTVRKGDNLTNISRRYGTTAGRIIKDNNLKSNIKIGQQLKIKN